MKHLPRMQVLFHVPTGETVSSTRIEVNGYSGEYITLDSFVYLTGVTKVEVQRILARDARNVHIDGDVVWLPLAEVISLLYLLA